ncbi:transcriptional regulator [Pusillimonas caeni]|nr:transcriptional regulator [Pusillimonas caeni]
MGKKNTVRPKSLADALFSGTKQRVLAILYGQPERSFYANELIGLAASGSGAVQRELATLTDSGLATVKTVGNQKHYQANLDSPIFGELRAIIQKTVGLADPLKEALEPFAPLILAAFIYGSIAKRTDTVASDIDLMLISNEVSYGELFLALEEVSIRLGRPVNPTIWSLEEFERRHVRQESFLSRVIKQPKIWLIGGNDVLGIREPMRPGEAFTGRAS